MDARINGSDESWCAVKGAEPQDDGVLELGGVAALLIAERRIRCHQTNLAELPQRTVKLFQPVEREKPTAFIRHCGARDSQDTGEEEKERGGGRRKEEGGGKEGRRRRKEVAEGGGRKRRYYLLQNARVS